MVREFLLSPIVFSVEQNVMNKGLFFIFIYDILKDNTICSFYLAHLVLLWPPLPLHLTIVVYGYIQRQNSTMACWFLLHWSF